MVLAVLTATTVRVLTVNAGSTSVKLSVVEGGTVVAGYASLDEAVHDVAASPVVAHRIVHGGPRTAPAVVDDDLRRQLGGLVDLAPLHQPPALEALDRCREVWPGATHVACFVLSDHFGWTIRLSSLPVTTNRYVRNKKGTTCYVRLPNLRNGLNRAPAIVRL